MLIFFILIVILADFDTTYDLNLIIYYHNYPYLESCFYLGKYWANYVAYFNKQQIVCSDVSSALKSYLYLTILIIQDNSDVYVTLSKVHECAY
jgi:hypothetical protein